MLCLKCQKKTDRKQKGKPLCRPCSGKHKNNKEIVRNMGRFESLLWNFSTGESILMQIPAKIILRIFYVR